MKFLHLSFKAGIWLVALVIAAVILATWRGGLWPFDPRLSLLMAVSGLIGIIRIWALLWLIVALAAIFAKTWRLGLLWLAGVMAAMGLHAVRGPIMDLAPIEHLGLWSTLSLYLIPSALAVWLGWVIGALLRRQK